MAYKKQATFKEYTIGVRENNSIEVLVNGKPYDGAVKPLLQDNIAQNVGLSVEKKWNTQDLGRKLVDFINNKETKMGKPTSNKNKKKTPAILINIMYSGSYLKENLGHEVINLMATDNGEHYIYINPIGKIGKDAIKKYNIKYILLGQLIDAQTVKVIAKATGLKMLESTEEALTGKENNANKGRIPQEIYDRHKRELKDVRYGKKDLVDIFPDERQLLATYSAKQVVEARRELFLRYEKDRNYKKYKVEDPAGDGIVIFLPNTIHPGGKKEFQFSRENPYMYFPQINDNEKSDYNKINEIIENEDFWEEESVGQYKTPQRTYDLPLEIMQKEDWELAYSNMIAYYLRDNKSTAEKFIKFLQKKYPESKIPEPTRDCHIEIRRESKDIDILIMYDDTAIIIENKIKADISTYKEYKGQKYKNQLEKYIKVMDEDKEYKYYKKNFFLLQPDYRKVNPDNYLFGDDKGKYKMLKYSDLFDFFDKNSHECNSDDLKNEEALNFNFFKESLKLHTEKIDNRNFNTMMRRLGKRIKDIKEHK